MSGPVTFGQTRPEEAAPVVRASRRWRPGRKLLTVVAAVAVLVAGFLAVRALVSDEEGGKLEGSGGETFSLSYPEGWSELSERDLGLTSGEPVAGIRRDDGAGFVLVRREGRMPRNLDRFTGGLTWQLDRRVPDFQRRSARVVRTSGGQAYFYSYIRRRRGTVHSIVVAPAERGSYALNTVSRGGREDVAREIAKIILSFKPR